MNDQVYTTERQSRHVNVKTKLKLKFVAIIHVICPNSAARTLPAFSSATVLAHATLHLFLSAVNGTPLATMEPHLLHPTLSAGVSVTHRVPYRRKRKVKTTGGVFVDTPQPEGTRRPTALHAVWPLMPARAASSRRCLLNDKFLLFFFCLRARALAPSKRCLLKGECVCVCVCVCVSRARCVFVCVCVRACVRACMSPLCRRVDLLLQVYSNLLVSCFIARVMCRTPIHISVNRLYRQWRWTSGAWRWWGGVCGCVCVCV